MHNFLLFPSSAYLVERSANAAPCGTNEEETARTTYDIEGTKGYKKHNLKTNIHKFMSQKLA